jgi:hypothetical protein
MAPFDFFIALDGNGLNGFEGLGGIARLRCSPDQDRWDGRIAPGLYADLVVIRGDTEHPYRALIDAGPDDVLATLVSGEALYGEPRLLDALGKQRQYQSIAAELACGEERGIDVLVDGIAGGDETLQDVVETLEHDASITVMPLIECPPAPTGAP